MNEVATSDRATVHTFPVETLDPLGDRFGRRIELLRSVGLARPALYHASHHRLSTFGRQRRILMDVSSGLSWNTEASQPRLPRVRPDGQPPERTKPIAEPNPASHVRLTGPKRKRGQFAWKAMAGPRSQPQR